VTPVFAQPEAFESLLDDLGGLLAGTEFTTIVAVDALGFVLGTALAVRGHKRLVPARKGGKLPVQSYTATFVDYTGETKSLEIRRDALNAGTRVLVVDERVETGAQVLAAISLVERLGGVVAGVASIHIEEPAAARLTGRGYACFSASKAKT
jgi:adenine phosphoribosyltransferase